MNRTIVILQLTIKENKTSVSLDGFLFVNAMDIHEPFNETNQVSTGKYIAKAFIIICV
jgi:hypothetical protein